MKNIVIASIIAIATAAPLASAFAATGQFEDRGMDTVRINRHAMKVHVMKMDDGTIIYGMTRAELERLNAKWLTESKSTDGSGR